MTLGVMLVLLAYVGAAAYFTYGMVRSGRVLTQDVLPTIVPAKTVEVHRRGGSDNDAESGSASKPILRSSQTAPTPKDPLDDIHIVFSTGCNLFQVRAPCFPPKARLLRLTRTSTALAS